MVFNFGPKQVRKRAMIEEELHNFPYIKLHPFLKDSEKTYSTLELSNSAMELLRFDRYDDRVISYGYNENDELIIVNVSGVLDMTHKYSYFLSKQGKCNIGKLYSILIKTGLMDNSIVNTVKLEANGTIVIQDTQGIPTAVQTAKVVFLNAEVLDILNPKELIEIESIN